MMVLAWHPYRLELSRTFRGKFPSRGVPELEK